MLERWIVPTFTSWGDESGIRDQHSFSEKCGELGTCEVLKVRRGVVVGAVGTAAPTRLFVAGVRFFCGSLFIPLLCSAYLPHRYLDGSSMRWIDNPRRSYIVGPKACRWRGKSTPFRRNREPKDTRSRERKNSRAEKNKSRRY